MRHALCLATLVLSSLGWVMASVAAESVEFTALCGWDQQLFPSYLVATATLRVPEEAGHEDESAGEDEVADEDETADDEVAETESDAELEESAAFVLGDEQGVLGVSLVSPRDDAPVVVTITCDALCQPSVFRGTLPEAGATYDIYPAMKYQFDRLTRNKQSVPVAVSFHVEVDGQTAEQTATLTLRSVNDCPFALVQGDEVTDVSFMFAAYVNEQHPFVDKVLREALDEGVVESFTGYQSGDSSEVLRQVYALWHALSQRDVRYSSITKSAVENTSVYSQHVRLIDQSLNNAQANCVDGSVLLASLLRKIDIEPALVFVPGHCYLAFFLDREQNELVGLETTLVGSTPAEDAARDESLDEVVGEEWVEESSWATFTAALAIGSQGLEDNQAHFDDPQAADYQVIPIAAARALGILPIAFDSAEAFQAAAADE